MISKPEKRQRVYEFTSPEGGGSVAVDSPAAVRPNAASLPEDDARDRYADLYDLSPVAYVTLGPTGLIEDINTVGAHLLGHERGRLIQKPLSSFINSYYQAILNDHLTRCLETGHSIADIQLRKRCGTSIEAQMMSVALPREAGDDPVFRTALIDITKHRQTAEALRKSELKYRALYNWMAEGFAFFAVLHGERGPADYRVVDVNPAFERITGIDRSRAIGSRGSTLCGGTAPFLAEFAAVASSGKPIVMEAVPFLGKPALRLSVFSPARGSFAIVFEDISERLATEKALRESEERYRLLVEHAPEAIAVFSGGEFVFVNRASLDLFGAAADDDLLGSPVLDMVQPANRHIFQKLMDRTAQGEPAPLQEMQLVRVDGGEVDVEIVGTPTTYRGLPAMQAILRDMTDHRRAKQALLRANDELEKRVSERTAQLARTIDALQKEVHSRRETEKALRSSQERYSLAVTGANDGIWDWDIATGTVYLSSRWKGMIGYTDDEFPNDVSAWRGAIHPEDVERVDSSLHAYLEGTTPAYQVEHRLRHRNGSYRWVLTKGACLRDDGGNAYRMAGSHTDITERKLAEEQVLRINHLYAVLSETNKAIVRSGTRLTLLSEVCRVAVEHGGFSLAWVGILNKGTGVIEPIAVEGVHKDFLSQVTISITEEEDEGSPVVAALREGKCQYTNLFLQDSVTTAVAGRVSSRFYSAAAVPFLIDGEGMGVLALYADEEGFFHQQMIELLDEMAADISFALDRFDREFRHRQAELALQAETARRLQAVEALREREQMLMHQSRLAAIGEMIGNIAHQWRQPLNTLGLYLQGMSVAWDMDDFDREYAESTVTKSMQVIFHMSQTIDDFRYFFKPDKEKVEFHVRELVGKTVSLMDGSYRDQHIALQVVEEDDPLLEGYPNEFSQVLLNILSNARDAIVERQVQEPRVVVKLANDDGKAVVTISDNAGGIPEEIIGKIFDPYFTTKDPDRGTGVGLFISKTIIEKNMGGRLTVRNMDGGAEFRIEV